ncbi:MAG: hypothetical protein HY332_20375, partial [Chloroflexi bacterium]|nr:hypothetical protein [Chloroflexota bacterium]
VIGPLRLDGARWTPPPPRRPGQKGRPRKRGDRLPAPAAQAQARQHWPALPVTLSGRTGRPLVCRGTALWYRVLRDAPVRSVVVRDPSGRRQDAACCGTDVGVSVAFLLETYAKRWTWEVTCFLVKGRLGFDEPQHQTVLAVRRTAPLAGLVFALLVRWYATELQAGRAATWVVRPWYRRKAAPSFADVLATLRQRGLAQATLARGYLAVGFSTPPCPPRRLQKAARRRHPPRCLQA